MRAGTVALLASWACRAGSQGRGGTRPYHVQGRIARKKAGGAFIRSALLLLALASVSSFAAPVPFDGKTFKGRIACSADGNHNDEDDWAASPVALAIFAQCGVKDRLVHFDYNCILPQTDLEWEKIHAASVLGAAERYGYASSIFHDCRKDLDGAINSIAKAINESSAENPLYFIVAGPMEVPFLGIQKSEGEKRKFVYCISHSRWNDGFAQKYTFTHTKRSVIPSGIKWVQIRDQNQLLSTSPYGRPARPEEWRPWHWMRDSDDRKVRFLWERMLVSTRADCSDAGMAYFLMTGDEAAENSKLRRLLEEKIVPTPIGARKHVRLETENFLTLEGYAVEDRNDRQASHRLGVKLAEKTGRIRTPFDQPYAAATGNYDVDVRYFDEKAVRSQFALSINGVRQSAAWNAPGTGQGWTTKTIPDVRVNLGDEIMVEVQTEAGATGRLDYVELKSREASSQSADRKK
ncbi:MAG: hypothetical protein HY735_24740 [Verrucomicrobia bacterium]|nr:hypothetical protein [Verrucomicrobiota bacterium]